MYEYCNVKCSWIRINFIMHNKCSRGFIYTLPSSCTSGGEVHWVPIPLKTSNEWDRMICALDDNSPPPCVNYLTCGHLNSLNRCVQRICFCGVSEPNWRPALDGSESGLTAIMSFTTSILHLRYSTMVTKVTWSLMCLLTW